MASRVSAYVKEGYIVRVRPDVNTFVSSRQAASTVTHVFRVSAPCICIGCCVLCLSRASADGPVPYALPQEARSNSTARATALLKAGAHILSTDFPTLPTYFPSTYAVRLCYWISTQLLCWCLIGSELQRARVTALVSCQLPLNESRFD